MNELELWQRYRKYLCACPTIGLQVDISRMLFPDGFLDTLGERMSRAFSAMTELERGAEANVDEHRMVGHYWLRTPELAPDVDIRADIERTVAVVKQFTKDVHEQKIVPERSDGFFVVLVIGIGGSALGVQFVCDALGRGDDPMVVRFIDNTDPDGIDRILDEVDESLDQTLTIVISKSGDTKETRNGMLEVAAAYRRAGLNFAKHAVAITREGSSLHQRAVGEHWLATLPMWDWVGGRTSVLSAVGLLPTALQGVDIDSLLSGARECDIVTRSSCILDNPAALMAAMWHFAREQCDQRNMVILPYRDRLALFSRYLQQLVMESIGKERSRTGQIVHQGLTVYGNKGSTDQHAFVQQLRDGPDDFFVTFIEVLRDRQEKSVRVEEDVSTGDYLHGFLYGTRAALDEKGRQSITITLNELNARSVGVLIALFERAVGLYAELIDVNAYDQPGVEAGKKAADRILDLQRKVLLYLRTHRDAGFTVEAIAEAIGEPDAVEAILHLLDHAAANPDHEIKPAPEANPSAMTTTPNRSRAVRLSARYSAS
jgi:glucose-6-phosphate isomerase